jgi:hypothetical protein
MSRFIYAILLVVTAASLNLAGCAYISVQTEPFLGVPNYPASDPERVVIIADGVVNRPYERLGKIYLDVDESPSRELIEKKLRYAVAEWGGDAAVIIYDKNRVFPVVYMDYGGGGVSQEMRRGIVALAIKYK